jgi:hypothetical protein
MLDGTRTPTGRDGTLSEAGSADVLEANVMAVD